MIDLFFFFYGASSWQHPIVLINDLSFNPIGQEIIHLLQSVHSLFIFLFSPWTGYLSSLFFSLICHLPETSQPGPGAQVLFSCLIDLCNYKRGHLSRDINIMHFPMANCPSSSLLLSFFFHIPLCLCAF